MKDMQPRGVSEESFDAIEAIARSEYGAHMEKDIIVIVDVEPDEAELLLSLVENLFDDWYIARQKRQERLARVTLVLKRKKQSGRVLRHSACWVPPSPPCGRGYKIEGLAAG